MSVAEQTLAKWGEDIPKMILESGWFVTRNEHRHDGNFPLPSYPYCYVVLREFTTYDRLIVPKSRQVMITWLVAAFCVASALITKNEQSIYQTKREDDAAAFMERVFFLYNHLPEWIRKIRPKLPPQKENKMKLELPTQSSKVWGVPSGAEVVRMHTITRFIADEANFQPEAKASLRAAAPAIGDTGQMIYISSANAGGIQQGLIEGSW